MEEERRERKGIQLNILLFAFTVLSTFFVGTTWSLSYKYADIIGQDSHFEMSLGILTDPQILFLSGVYAVVLLGILSGHELGHYLACRYYGINATLPYFIPAPTLVGTLGAFIKIKSPITHKQHLFDIGVAGPLTGFFLSLPAVVYGLHLSKVVESLPREETLVFGEPLLLKIVGGIIFRDIPPGQDIILHPIAFAGWVGILVTAFNLFPVGQLDGGHISYALLGARSRTLARIVLVVFFIMGVFLWIGWFIWALIILVLGLKHPRIMDEETPLSRPRKYIGIVALLIFILSFIPDPIRGYNLFSVMKQFSF